MEASLICKAKTRMLDIKANYKNKYKPNLQCSVCKKEIEDQNHIFEKCEKIHRENETRISKDDLYNEDIKEIRNTGNKIKEILRIIEEQVNSEKTKKKKEKNKEQKNRLELGNNEQAGKG